MKRYLTYILLVISLSKAMGQHIFITPEVGYGLTSYNDYYDKFKSKTDFGSHYQLGLGLYVPFTKNVYFSGKALFQKRVAGYTPDGTTKLTDTTKVLALTLSNIAVPLNFVIMEKLSKSATLYVGVGATYSHFLSGNFKDTEYGNLNGNSGSFSSITFGRGIDKLMRRNTWSLNLNVGILLKNRVSFNIYSNIGITNLINTGIWNTASSRIVENGISVGYWIPIDKHKNRWY